MANTITNDDESLMVTRMATASLGWPQPASKAEMHFPRELARGPCSTHEQVFLAFRPAMWRHIMTEQGFCFGPLRNGYGLHVPLYFSEKGAVDLLVSMEQNARSKWDVNTAMSDDDPLNEDHAPTAPLIGEIAAEEDTDKVIILEMLIPNPMFMDHVRTLGIDKHHFKLCWRLWAREGLDPTEFPSQTQLKPLAN